MNAWKQGSVFDHRALPMVVFGFLGPKWAIFRVGVRFKNCLRVSLNTATTFIFYVSFNSDIWFRLYFGVIFAYWDPDGLFLGSRYFSKTFLGSDHKAEKLLFSVLPSITTFVFDLILGSFWDF